MKKQRWSKLRKTLFTLVSLIALTVYVHHNLTYYSVYYATNLPHKEGTNPVLVMVARNFEKIELPSEYIVQPFSGIGASSYLFDTKTLISLDRIIGINVGKPNTSVYFEEETGAYLTDSIYDKELVRDVPFTDEQRQQFLSELDAFLSDIVEVQVKPFINLQWLFNYLHESAFNE